MVSIGWDVQHAHPNRITPQTNRVRLYRKTARIRIDAGFQGIIAGYGQIQKLGIGINDFLLLIKSGGKRIESGTDRFTGVGDPRSV